MTANRRTGWNFALQRSAERAQEMGKPLLVFEPLRCDYQWASERFHRFLLDGMADNRNGCRRAGVTYYPFVEPELGHGKGLLRALSEHACLVVGDDYPGFFYPHMLGAAARQVATRLEAVDACGLLPLAAADRVFPRAYSFRRFLQKNLPRHLDPLPEPDPLAPLKGVRKAKLPGEILTRWPPADPELLESRGAALTELPVDHTVGPVDTPGGSRAGNLALNRFATDRLRGYDELRNHPDEDATSGLSPYLHFGHVSTHQVFAEVMMEEGWSEDLLSTRATGSRTGWWGVSAPAEAFLDQLVTWRELGFNGWHVAGDGWTGYAALPEWARATLDDHRGDPRPYCYSREELEAARTHDQLWNAAQTELLRAGRLHNYLRMLWGKKVLEWTSSPEAALEILYTLNDRYALDGRDPNSVSGITWCFGQYDRAWGPEREVFGKVRYMSSKNTARKVRLRNYLERYAPGPANSGTPPAE
jgi:deoxyribodipyrimidine photo-lyase